MQIDEPNDIGFLDINFDTLEERNALQSDAGFLGDWLTL
jgi:hypothetical protein